jgi:hypothetical protein
MSAAATPFALRMPPDIRAVALGEHRAVVIDDFLENPAELLEWAARATFEDCPGMAEGKGYPGMRAPVPEAYSHSITELLDPLIRLNFGVPEGLPLKKTPCAFSLTTMAPEALGPLQRTPHFDASTPHHMAALLYLCGPEHGGTGFYRHQASGLQRITAANREPYLDLYYEEINARRPAPRYFDRSDDRFTLLGMIPARFNRMVIYPGSLLHSACIDPARSISADPRAGRLTANTFYDF